MTPALKPGGGPARLLLELWSVDPIQGTLLHEVYPCREKSRLMVLGYLSGGPCVEITPAGREVAQALEASK